MKSKRLRGRDIFTTGFAQKIYTEIEMKEFSLIFVEKYWEWQMWDISTVKKKCHRTNYCQNISNTALYTFSAKWRIDIRIQMNTQPIVIIKYESVSIRSGYCVHPQKLNMLLLHLLWDIVSARTIPKYGFH